MTLNLKGTLAHIGNVEVVNEKLSKRIFTITVQNGTFTDIIAFTLLNDKTGKIDGIAIGSEITVDFNLKSREWNGKYFTDAQAWKITSSVVANQPPAAPVAAASGGATSDLPF